MNYNILLGNKYALITVLFISPVFRKNQYKRGVSMSYKKPFTNLIILSAIAVLTPESVLASGGGEKIKTKKASSFPDSVANPTPGEIIVKCAGIAKKGKNHCGANGHACNGLSAKDPNIKDFDKNEWIYVREGVCNATPGKIVGKKRVVKG